MRILIEEYKYQAKDVEDLLEGITNLRDVDGKVSINYVGYYYNPKLKDCIFILPKVLFEVVNKEELVFGHCKPEAILSLESQNELSSTEHDFIYELSVWIYRAISLYKDTHSKSNIVLQQNVQQMSKGRTRRKNNTFLDILLAIQKFNRENQDFFFFILRNIHSGYNKINWNRTISTTNAIIQDQNPIYLNPVNKKRQINFDEELLIIFFSILNYINNHYGFPVSIDVNFPLITGQKFENYLKGFGKTRLRQIKFKYFADKALYLWDLCYAFFDKSKEINIDVNEREYLLVKNFNIVFEAIIDELIGDKNIPEGLKEQEDGKRVDHLYTYKDLIHNENEQPIYYIGDSKYYKKNTSIDDTSVYKQFTYAKNVIQWNLNLFMNDDIDKNLNVPKLRDDITEGYNIIPNFFISAEQKDLHAHEDILKTDKDKKYFKLRHYDNRLFDRDTLLVTHYDVNFLFIVALYGRNNPSEKSAWREKVRKMFRDEIQKILENNFDFFILEPIKGINLEYAVERHFKKLNGKIYKPQDCNNLLIMALDKDNKYMQTNHDLISDIENSFYIYHNYHLGSDPKEFIKSKQQ